MTRPRKAGYFVYVVECADGTLYTGITNDLPRRIREHNSKAGARYTKSRTPVVLRYATRARGRSDAQASEYQIKRLSRSKKLLLCATYSRAKTHSLR